MNVKGLSSPLANGEISAVRNEGGFTLLEIAIAVAILAVGLTTILSMQARQLYWYTNDRNLAFASLASQYVMTMIEIADAPPTPGSDSGDLASLLKKYKYFEGESSPEEEERFAGMQYGMAISAIDLPLGGDIPPLKDIMRRVDLRVSWGDSPDEEFSLIYYVKTEAGEGEDDEG